MPPADPTNTPGSPRTPPTTTDGAEKGKLQLITKESIAALIGSAVSIVGSILALLPYAPPIANDPFSNAMPTVIGVCIYFIITALYFVQKNSSAFRNLCIIACFVSFIGTCFLGVEYYSMYNSKTLKSPDGSIRIVIGSVFTEDANATMRASGNKKTLVELVEDDAAWKQPEKIFTGKSIQESKEALTQLFIALAGCVEAILLTAIYLIVPRLGKQEIPAGADNN